MNEQRDGSPDRRRRGQTKTIDERIDILWLALKIIVIAVIAGFVLNGFSVVKSITTSSSARSISQQNRDIIAGIQRDRKRRVQDLSETEHAICAGQKTTNDILIAIIFNNENFSKTIHIPGIGPAEQQRAHALDRKYVHALRITCTKGGKVVHQFHVALPTYPTPQTSPPKPPNQKHNTNK